MQRRLFVSGIAFTGLAGCAGAGGALNSIVPLNSNGLRRAEKYCAPSICPPPPFSPPTPATTLAKSTRITAPNYVGITMKNAAGSSLKAIDSYGATCNGIISPGSSLTINGNGVPSAVVTSSHPIFLNQSFKLGTITFTPHPTLPMGRFTDPTYGSGAVWLASTATTTTLYMAYSGFASGNTLQIAQGGRNPNQPPPPTCEQQAANMAQLAGAIAIVSGLVSLLAPEVKIAGQIGSALGIGGGAASIASGAHCPPPPSPGGPTASSLLGGLDINTIMVSGGPEPPDGGGAGSDGTDQILFA